MVFSSKDLLLDEVFYCYNEWKQNTGTLEVDAEYNGYEIKYIDSSACSGGNIECLDLRKTKIETIGNGAFSGCRNLTVVYFSETLTSIWQNAFCRSGIEELNIVKTLVNFDGFAFNQSPNLNNIVVNSSN